MSKQHQGHLKDTSSTILQSALSVMAEDGVGNLTTKAVSQDAQVSTASIHYFFDTKQKLIYEAFVYVVQSVRRRTIAIRKSQSDPKMRIRKMVELHFSARQTSTNALSVWSQFWVHAAADEKTGRLFKLYSARLISNFTADCVALGLDREAARLKAITICGLIHGLWLEQHLGNVVSAEDTNAIFEQFLARSTSKRGPTSSQTISCNLGQKA
ncbi:MAG: TetR family transcriptional regulator C-terminal domain-containing protein [Pseudomonadota bacterium]